MKLIDKDTLGVSRCNPDIFKVPGRAEGWNSLLDIVNSAPTIDPVEAAGGCYCRECVNNIPDGNGKPYCRWLELYIKDLNFFCRDGQRKETDHDKHPSDPV